MNGPKHGPDEITARRAGGGPRERVASILGVWLAAAVAGPLAAQPGPLAVWEGRYLSWTQDVTGSLTLKPRDDGAAATLEGITNFAFGCDGNEPDPECRVGSCLRTGRLVVLDAARAFVDVDEADAAEGEPCRIDLERSPDGALAVAPSDGCTCLDMGSGRERIAALTARESGAPDGATP